MLPGLFDGRDKSWWFFAWQSERIGELETLTGTVPAAAQKSGQFAEAIIDPLTGQPFANNTIPSSRFDPVFNKLVGSIRIPTPILAVDSTTSPIVLPQTRPETRSSSRWISKQVRTATGPAASCGVTDRLRSSTRSRLLRERTSSSTGPRTSPTPETSDPTWSTKRASISSADPTFGENHPTTKILVRRSAFLVGPSEAWMWMVFPGRTSEGS